jgi:hypothetical protein
MNIMAFGALLLVAGSVLAPTAFAQTESAPPNVIESKPASDRADTDKSRSGSNVSFTFRQTGASSGPQEEIPMAPRVDNTANNPPVDRATSK